MSKNNNDKDLSFYEDFQKRLVSSLVYDGSNAIKVFEIIQADYITEPLLNKIMVAINELSHDNEDINLSSISYRLQAKGELSQDGINIAYLTGVYNDGSVYMRESTPLQYARGVKEYYAKDKISKIIGDSINNFKENSGVTAMEAVSSLQSEINDNIAGLSDESMKVDFNEYTDSYLELLEKRKVTFLKNKDGTTGLQGIPSLLPTLNKITRGWQPGQMITVGARTGVGKSIFAVNCALAAAKAGKTVLFFSLEMGVDELYDRMVASMTSVSLNALKDGNLTSVEEESVQVALEEISNMNIIVDCTPEINIEMIRSKAYQQSQRPAGLDLIIIDYLQLIAVPSTGNKTRQEQVASISRSVKILTKQLQVPIINLVQLSKLDKNDDNDKEPRINDIRESNAIAQDSDIVILLHRAPSYDGKTPITIVKLEKHRGGEANKIIRCNSNLAYSIFVEIKKEPDNDNDNLEDYNDSEKNEVFSTEKDSEEQKWAKEFEF